MDAAMPLSASGAPPEASVAKEGNQLGHAKAAAAGACNTCVGREGSEGQHDTGHMAAAEQRKEQPRATYLQVTACRLTASVDFSKGFVGS
jgi:hypothetical protein